MTTGTVIAGFLVKDSSGHTIIDARVEDRVEGNGSSTITKLTRAGVVKFVGSGYVNTWTGYIKPDVTVEPPPPVESGPFPQRFRLTNTDTSSAGYGTSADYVKV